MRDTLMFNNRRSEIEIIKEIITLSQDGMRKTEILYQANLSFAQLKHYLKYLLDKLCRCLRTEWLHLIRPAFYDHGLLLSF